MKTVSIITNATAESVRQELLDWAEVKLEEENEKALQARGTTKLAVIRSRIGVLEELIEFWTNVEIREEVDKTEDEESEEDNDSEA